MKMIVYQDEAGVLHLALPSFTPDDEQGWERVGECELEMTSGAQRTVRDK